MASGPVDLTLPSSSKLLHHGESSRWQGIAGDLLDMIVEKDVTIARQTEEIEALKAEIATLKGGEKATE